MKVSHVIVIDDEVIVRESLLRLLEAMGFSVSGFATAEGFLNALPLKTHESWCILSDLRLHGMDAIELRSMLTGHGVYNPMIILTGAYDGALARRASAVGIREILEKPIAKEELQAALDRLDQPA